jgi:hypothetical protein
MAREARPEPGSAPKQTPTSCKERRLRPDIVPSIEACSEECCCYLDLALSRNEDEPDDLEPRKRS